MTKPTRPSEHVQRDKPAAEAPPAGISTRRPDAPAEPAPDSPALDPVMSQRYWVVILLWAVSFVLMFLYELITAIWRG